VGLIAGYGRKGDENAISTLFPAQMTIFIFLMENEKEG